LTSKEKAAEGWQRLTIQIRPELAERLRNAVYWTPGLTVAGLVEESLGKALASLEKRKGGPFPPRKGKQLKRGRPVR
jgi:hypothetical protein